MPENLDPIEQQEQDANARALEAAERLEAAQAEAKEVNQQKAELDTAEEDLIGGKFKSQEDLLKAYEELQKKLGSKDETEAEEPSEEQPEATEEEPKEEEPEVEETEVAKSLRKFSDEYNETGDLSEDAIEALSAMDSKELVTEYLRMYKEQAAQAKQQQQAEVDVQSILGQVGGQEKYNEMVSWAAENLPAADVDDYNAVVNSGNTAAVKFAVAALHRRMMDEVGYEAPMVSGKRKAPAKAAGYRSQAELNRDLRNPLYKTDPAFRQDVEEKLARSTNLL